MPHSLALFEETDVLCVADREGGRVECIQAGLQKPLHANRDDTGRRVVNYNSRRIGRPYAIAAKGTALLVLRGSPGAKGLTIDTAAEPEEEPIIDEWGKSDVSIQKSGILDRNCKDQSFFVSFELSTNPLPFKTKNSKFTIYGFAPANLRS